MRPSRPSTAHSSPRRALHERSPSHTNESSPPESLRHVRSKSSHNSSHGRPSHEQENHQHQQHEGGVYSASPYPTKPEHVLLPVPGKGLQEVTSQNNPPALSSGTIGTISSVDNSHLDSSVLDPSGSDSWFDLVANSQSWLNDPDSSRSSFPQGHDTDHNDSEQEKKTIASDDDMSLPPPPTVKPVSSGPPSRHQSPYHSSHSSSPNVMPIGPPSSPNFVALDNSSLNFVTLGTSSNPASVTHRSNSVSSSVNSLGTVIRHVGAAPWTHGSSSDRSSWAARSFHSTPPYQSATGSAQSNSSHPSHERNQSRSLRSRSQSHTSSSRSGPGSDVQAVVDSGVYIQFPVIHPPSSSGSWVEASQTSQEGPSNPDQLEASRHELLPERSDSRITSHLSTVPSQWSAECDNSFADESTDRPEPPRPVTALGVRRADPSSMWMVNDSDEQLDNVARLPTPASRRASIPSATSRRSSMRSVQRPGTSGSYVSHFLPTWAQMYYQNGHGVNSSLSLHDNQQSSRGPAPIQRPQAARPKTCHGVVEDGGKAEEDPRDPRSHWVVPEPEERPQTGMYQLRHSWSPHLYADRQREGTEHRASAWVAPSLDSRTEPLLGRRNLQVWSFCLGFIFPIAWFVAAFLPLPPKPDLELEATMPETEVALQARLYDLERRRHDNARWWRNLNRWMTPLGLAIVTIIVSHLHLVESQRY